jgi:hypothetical protein
MVAQIPPPIMNHKAARMKNSLDAFGFLFRWNIPTMKNITGGPKVIEKRVITSIAIPSMA